METSRIANNTNCDFFYPVLNLSASNILSNLLTLMEVEVFRINESKQRFRFNTIQSFMTVVQITGLLPWITFHSLAKYFTLHSVNKKANYQVVFITLYSCQSGCLVV